jgi:hypothetical protein
VLSPPGEGSPAEEAHQLSFDHSFLYSGTDLDARPLPRLPVYATLPDNDEAPVGLEPVRAPVQTALPLMAASQRSWDGVRRTSPAALRLRAPFMALARVGSR